MKQNIAVITGASEGIGAALTKLLIQHNWKVIGLSRNLEKLKLLRNSLLEKKTCLKIYSCNKGYNYGSNFSSIFSNNMRLCNYHTCILRLGLCHMA